MAAEHIDPTALALTESLPRIITDLAAAATAATDDPTELPRRQQATFEEIYPDPLIRRSVPRQIIDQIGFTVKEGHQNEIETGVLFNLLEQIEAPEYVGTIAAVEAAARRPATARATWMDRNRATSVGQTDALLIDLIALQEQQAIKTDLRDARPSTVLEAWRTRPDSTGAVRRYIEEAHGGGWSGRATEDPEEAAAMLVLRREITTAQEARIPTAVRAAREALSLGSSVLRRIQTLRGFVPRRPFSKL